MDQSTGASVSTVTSVSASAFEVLISPPKLHRARSVRGPRVHAHDRVRGSRFGAPMRARARQECSPRFHCRPVVVMVAGPAQGTRAQVGPSVAKSTKMRWWPCRPWPSHGVRQGLNGARALRMRPKPFQAGRQRSRSRRERFGAGWCCGGAKSAPCAAHGRSGR